MIHPFLRGGAKTISRFRRLQFFVWLGAIQTAYSLLTPAFAASDFSLREQKVQAPEMGEILSYVLTAGNEEYSFMPPHNWRVGIEPERHRILFQAPDGASSISVLVAGHDAQEPPAPEVLRHQIQGRFTQGRIAEEFACYANNYQGKGFQVQWIAAGQVPMLSRVAYISTPRKTYEFTLTTMSNRFRSVQPALGSLMTSFHNKQKLENAPLAASRTRTPSK